MDRFDKSDLTKRFHAKYYNVMLTLLRYSKIIFIKLDDTSIHIHAHTHISHYITIIKSPNAISSGSHSSRTWARAKPPEAHAHGIRTGRGRLWAAVKPSSPNGFFNAIRKQQQHVKKGTRTTPALTKERKIFFFRIKYHKFTSAEVLILQNCFHNI